MKKIIRFLISVTLVLSSITYFYIEDSNQAVGKFPDFDKFINLVNYDDKDIKNQIMSAANDNNIDLIKFVDHTRFGIADTMDVDVYIYLSKASKFEKNHKDLKIIKNKNGLNQFDSIKANSLLTENNINFIKFDDLDKDYLAGDYALSGKKEDVDSFVDDLKAYADIVQTPDYMSVSNLYMKDFFLMLVVNFIGFFTSIFILVIYNRSLTKELSVSLLFGYDKRKFAINKALNIILLPVIGTFIVDSFILNRLTNPDGFLGFLFAMRPIYLFIVLVGVFIFLLEFILLNLKANHEQILAVLKGHRKVSAKLLGAFKSIFAGCLAYLLVITIFSARDYKDVSLYLNNWNYTKSYANISIGGPWQYVIDGKKNKELMEKPIEELSHLLTDQGALLFMNPFNQIEGFDIPLDLGDSYKLNDGNFAYVNSNYLDKFEVLDKNNKALSLKAKANEWIILYPEGLSLTKADRDYITNSQIEETLYDKSELIQTYIPIKEGQQLAHINSRTSIDKPYVKNYVLILVNEDGLRKTDSLILKAIYDWNLHPYLENGQESLNTLKNSIANTPAAKYILWIETAYDYVNYKVSSYRNEMIVYIIASIILTIIYGFIIVTDHKNYYLNAKDELAVKSLFGYNFWIIHRKKIGHIIVSYLFATGIYYLVLRLSVRFGFLGFFSPRQGFTNGHITFGFILSLLVFAIFTLIEISLLKRKEDLALKLKEGN